MSIIDFLKPAKSTDYQKLAEDIWDAKQQEESRMTDSTIKFSVGPDPDGDGAVIVFTQSNGINTTVTMSPASVRLLIDLLEVVVPDDPQD